jgi:hypothetical protein
MRPRTSPKLPLSPADGIVWPATKVIEAALNGKFVIAHPRCNPSVRSPAVRLVGVSVAALKIT